MDSSDEAKPKGHCRHKCWKIPFFIVGFILVKSVVVMFLWNALIPELFHGPDITYLQAVGLIILSKLLIGCGFRPGGHGRGGPPWKRWHGLSEEERSKLREEMRGRCGHGIHE